MSLAIDREFLTQTLIDMVRIDSRNPSVSSDGPGEAELGAYVADLLSRLGLDVLVHEVEPDRVNIVGILGRTGGGRSLMLNGHLDTLLLGPVGHGLHAAEEWVDLAHVLADTCLRYCGAG